MDALVNRFKRKTCWLITITLISLVTLMYACGPGDSGTPSPESASRVIVLGAEQELERMITSAKGKQLVLVEFFTDWCSPCKDLAPLLEKIAEKYAEEVSVIKVDYDRYPDLAQLFAVRGVPYVVFIRDGEIVHSLLGLRPKEQYLSAIDKNRYQPSPKPGIHSQSPPPQSQSLTEKQ